MNFIQTHEKFLKSVIEKDWETFRTFLDSQTPFFSAVLPPGRVIKSCEEFLGLQGAYFQNTTGKFSAKTITNQESGDLGFSAIEAHYSDVGADMKPFSLKIYISFVFKRQNGRWILIHDQNTVLT